MLDGNLSNLNNFNKVSPYSRVDTANAMPINNLRIVQPVNQNLKSKEYVQNQNLREIYSSNLAPDSSFTTEKFDFFNEISFFEENTTLICDSGFNFNQLGKSQEVSFLPKKPKNKGFFEKFFHFFN